MSAAEQRYLNTHLYYDEKSGFTLNLSGFTPLANLDKTVKKYRYAIEYALQKLRDTEV